MVGPTYPNDLPPQQFLSFFLLFFSSLDFLLNMTIGWGPPPRTPTPRVARALAAVRWAAKEGRCSPEKWEEEGGRGVIWPELGGGATARSQ